MRPKQAPATRPMLTLTLGLLLAAALHSEALVNELPAVQSVTPASSGNASSRQQAGISSSRLTGIQTTRPSSNSSAPTSINLIPIDQPMLSSSGAESTASPVPTSPALIGRSMGSFQQQQQQQQNEIADSYDGSRLNLRSGQVAAPNPETGDDSFPQQQQQQHPSAANEEELNEQHYSNELPHQQAPAAISEQQQEVGRMQANLATSRQLERRFGLFKKGHNFQGAQHYGAPASYLAGNFMSECERCLASFGQSPPPPAAELQLEPVQPVAPPLVPQPSLPPASLPAPTSQHFPMQPFAPFKSKLFMKFPFLMKGGGGGHAFESQQATTLPLLNSYQHHYWPAPSLQPYSHSHHTGPPRPAPSSQALFVRPAPAYNCIQASPSLLQAAASTTSQTHEFVPLLGAPSKTSPNPIKQQQQQQQQQVQAGYARK